MKRTVSRLATTGVVATLVAGFALLAGSAAAGPDKTKPFKGSFAGTFVAREVPSDPKAVGTGNLSGLGLTTFTVRVDGVPLAVDASGFPIVVLTFAATTEWEAANGDKLFDTAIYVVSQNFFTGDATSVGVGTITGGTGRFEGATGQYDITNVVTAIPGPDNDPFTAEVDGRISTVGSNKK